MSTPRCIPHCPKCGEPAPAMPLAEYLRHGGPMCCGVYTRLAGDDEPPEPDGECFRGVEAAAYEAEQMAQWQRLK